MDIIVATNKYGIDEAPVVCETETSAIKEMRYLMVYGISNQKPEILEEFADAYIGCTIEDYEDLEQNDLIDDFFEWLENREDTDIDHSMMRIRFSEDESDVYEVNYWSSEYCSPNCE